MMRRWMSRSALALLAAAAGLALIAPSAADAASSSRVQKTQDGIYLEVSQKNLKIRSVPPLDSSPMSREAFLGATNTATITGPRGTLIQSAEFETGYQIGYPVSFAPTGIAVTMSTPSVSVGGGVNISPTITPTEIPIGGDVSADVTVIPAQTLSFTVEHGGITDVPLAQGAMNSPRASADFAGVHLMVNSAMGPVTVRTYTKMRVRTATGTSEVVTYGPAWRI